MDDSKYLIRKYHDTISLRNENMISKVCNLPSPWSENRLSEYEFPEIFHMKTRRNRTKIKTNRSESDSVC